ncbi:MAG: ATP-binding protein [Nitrospinae bacterium]|nr:ATP-binding protein [Nitrospinota bacterium]
MITIDPLYKLAQIAAIDIKDIPIDSWNNLLSMKHEREIIEKRIVHPLTHPALAQKHGLTIPRGMLLFGPPGTGKTTFAQGIASKLSWKFIEVSPGSLGDISGKESLDLKNIFDQAKKLENIVLFFDEFEELVLRPDKATKDEKGLSSEFLKQLQSIRKSNNILLICATNNIRMLNPALLRPGRFDFIMPVGPADKESRKIVFERMSKKIISKELDFDLIAEKSNYFTTADIIEVINAVAQKAFERELSSGKEYKSDTNDFIEQISSCKPTISKEEMETFRIDAREHCRTDYCHLY